MDEMIAAWGGLLKKHGNLEKGTLPEEFSDEIFSKLLIPKGQSGIFYKTID